MGFASGSVSFRRFLMCGQHPREVTQEWLEAAQRGAFGRYGDASADGVDVGWIAPTHLFATDLTPDRIQIDRFLFMALRMDRTAPPSAVVKSYRQMEEESALEASGKEFLSRGERREARDVADRRAEQEARSGAFRRMAAYPVLIDPEDGVVYFGQLGPKAADKLMTLFSDTFGVTLAPADVGEVAFRQAEQVNLTDRLDDVSPTYLVNHPAGGEPGDADGGLSLSGRAFLGREFLCWLWHRLVHDEGVMELRDGRTVSVAIQTMMNFECCYEYSGKASLRSELPAGLPEAAAALRFGKMPTKARLMLSADGQDWAVTLDATKWHLFGAILPPPDSDEPISMRVERFYHLRELSRLVDSLFTGFLHLRLRDQWNDEVARMARWAAQRPEENRPQVQLVSA